MSVPYVKPSYNKSEYSCPYCNAYAHQEWYIISHYIRDQIKILPSYVYDTMGMNETIRYPSDEIPEPPIVKSYVYVEYHH